MKTTTANILLAAGAFAQLASAVPHNRRDEVTITTIDYTTVIRTVTAGEPVASGAVAVAHSSLHRHHHFTHSGYGSGSSGSSSTDAPTSDSSSAAASSTSAFSVSASPFTTFSIPGDSSSAAAPASSSATSSSATATILTAYGGGAGASVSLASSSTAGLSAYGGSSSAGPSAYSSSTAAASPTAYSSSSAATTTTTSAPASTGTSSTGLKGYTGIKAGLSGYIGCESQPGFQAMAPYIGWYSDYSANTTGATTSTTPNVNGGVIQGIPMLWGDGISCASVSTGRLDGFKDAVASASEMPIMFGLYEPDCDCDMSSDISDVSQGVSDWNTYLAPLKSKFGTTLGSPSMCKQKDETWLTEFSQDSSSPTWDVTSIHINVNNMDDLKADIEYYVGKFGKPVWVTEFACVQGVPWTPCTDQDQINTFIEDAVAYFEGNSSVVAYGASNGEGLGDVWPLFTSDTHELSATGQKYLDVLSKIQY